MPLIRERLFHTALFAVAMWATAIASNARADDARPNVVLFVVDDLGWRDLGCCGHPVFRTPHIDALAAHGMRFTQAYSDCPVCSPTRAALLTGRSPARLRLTGHITATGKHRWPKDGRVIPPDDHMYLPLEEITLAELLAPAGYASASIGKWHLGGSEYWPKQQGFDLNVAGYDDGSPPGYFYPYESRDRAWNTHIPTLQGGEPGEYLTDRLTEEALAFVRAEHEQPFFLYLPHYAVHTPIQAPDALVEEYRQMLSSAPEKYDPTYAAMVERVDDSLGRLMAELQALGIAERTLVIVTSDNGGLASVTRNAPLRAGKGHLYEAGIRVPLLVCWPGHTAPGSTCDVPVITADLFATVADVCGVPLPTDVPLDGMSLTGLLTGKAQLEREQLAWYYPHYSPQASQPGAALRWKNYKLIDHYDPPRVELYDLATDPGERHDLAAEMPDLSDKLHARLQQWLKSVDAQPYTLNPNYSVHQP